MPSLYAQSELWDLIVKVEEGQRLNFDEGLRLINSQEILTLGYMANLIRERKNGNQTYFIVNRPIDYMDICASFEKNENRSNAMMVYGEKTQEELIKRLLELRTLQDQTKEFQSFSPIPFYSKTAKLEGTMGVGNTTGYEDLKMLTISRILLENFDHIKAFWLMLGTKLAQVSLAFGVDDLDGTVIEDRSTSTAGEGSEHSMSKRVLIQLIQKAGRDAVERDTLYRVCKTG
ncbi:FO synthase [Desulfosporosinus lacus]|uniref:Aminodeoxyfutalosine synthase n=1 Tax=Desulfosporosinus lacus DSM 15449 TaxID=1121420 RepID=A0A1M5XI90_9FIRM|nr:FO synthase [Desulfosporosinus lacus]SHH99537.1 aminodeoxyfutalosine synthase [Desulfosporosinus lacus DSM 15449]